MLIECSLNAHRKKFTYKLTHIDGN